MADLADVFALLSELDPRTLYLVRDEVDRIRLERLQQQKHPARRKDEVKLARMTV